MAEMETGDSAVAVKDDAAVEQAAVEEGTNETKSKKHSVRNWMKKMTNFYGKHPNKGEKKTGKSGPTTNGKGNKAEKTDEKNSDETAEGQEKAAEPCKKEEEAGDSATNKGEEPQETEDAANGSEPQDVQGGGPRESETAVEVF